MGHEKLDKIRAAVNTAVYHAICDDPSFSIDVPKLSPDLWERVSVQTPENKEENERLEFLGDKLMDSSIAIALYKGVPDGTPHKYTVMLSVLHANRTFCHLARKMQIDYRGADTKNIGDIFEVIVGAYYTEKGFEAVHAWAFRIYEPLVRDASIAFDECERKLGGSRDGVGDVSTSSGKGKSTARRRSSATEPRQTSPSSSRHIPSLNHERSHTEAAAASNSRPTDAPSDDETTSETLQHAHALSGGPGVHSSRHTKEETDESGGYSSSGYLPSDSGSDDEPLPDFWEEVRLSDGKVLFIDHRTETTTWDDPRRIRRPSPSPLRGVPAAWRARLMAGPDSDDEGRRTPTSQLGVLGTAAFPDLEREGYTAGEVPPDSQVHLFPDALPEFWELRRGMDGKTYYIDHINATIMPKGS